MKAILAFIMLLLCLGCSQQDATWNMEWGCSGYALITATSTSLTLQAKSKTGSVRHSLTL